MCQTLAKHIPIENVLIPIFVLGAKFEDTTAFCNFLHIATPYRHVVQPPQLVHGPRYCGIRPFPLKMHCGGEKIGQNREGIIEL